MTIVSEPAEGLVATAPPSEAHVAPLFVLTSTEKAWLAPSE
jgi:hypothetical protein